MQIVTRDTKKSRRLVSVKDMSDRKVRVHRSHRREVATTLHKIVGDVNAGKPRIEIDFNHAPKQALTGWCIS